MEPRLRLKRSPPQIGHEPGTARSVVQRFTLRAAGGGVSDTGNFLNSLYETLYRNHMNTYFTTSVTNIHS